MYFQLLEMRPSTAAEGTQRLWPIGQQDANGQGDAAIVAKDLDRGAIDQDLQADLAIHRYQSCAASFTAQYAPLDLVRHCYAAHGQAKR